MTPEEESYAADVGSTRFGKFAWYASAVLSGVLIAVAAIFYLVLDHTGTWLAIISIVGLLIVVARNVMRRRVIG
jgi:hypothetical protein